MFTSNIHISAQKLVEWNANLDLGLSSRSYKKGELILEEGQRCDYFYYILKGIVRLYYLDLNGNEITHWFSPKDSMVTSPFSFFKGERNILFFEALDETELILITFDQLNAVMNEYKAIEKGMRELYLEFTMAFSRRVMSIHTETAEERYLKLMKAYPDLFQKAKLSHIASYLGVTPQSLSRIRRNL